MAVKVTANDLRKLAEHADGRRGVKMKIVARGDDKLDISYDENDTSLFDVYTDATDNHPMGTPKEVTISYDERKVVFTNKDMDMASNKFLDSMFWTQSAIEKFMVPYYARIFSPLEMRDLRTAYTDPQVIAIGHRYPTIYEEVDAYDAILVKGVNPAYRQIVLLKNVRTGLELITLADYIYG